MMRRFLLLPVLALLAVACEFRPLEDPSNVSYIRVYVGEQDLNVTTGFYNPDFIHPDFQPPEVIRVALFDPETGVMVSERYLRTQGEDEKGTYFEGYIVAAPGTYNLLAYNFGTESTIVDEENNCYGMAATTNEIAPSLMSKLKSTIQNRSVDNDDNTTRAGTKSDDKIRYDADPLFVAGSEGITVRPHHGIDTLRSTTGNPWFDAETVVKAYFIQIGVTNAQYIASSSCLLSGMAASTHMLEPDFEQSLETTLYFPMHPGSYPDGYKPGVTDYRCIYSTFGTFGRLPGAENLLKASFEFTTTYGLQVDTTFNIALEFLKEDAIEHQWLVLDFEIEIPEPPPGEDSGGLKPGVDDWDHVDSEIDV